MRVLVVGASGTVGQATVKAFTDQGDDVVSAFRNSSPGIDITDAQSVKNFFKEAGKFDAIVATLGSAPFVHLEYADTEDFQAGIGNKLLGQINLVLHGLPYLNDGGSFTLITGILTQHPVKKSVVASTVNGGLEAFTYTASTDLPRGIRINVVSPNVVQESLDTYGAFFPGSNPVPAQLVANAFVRSAHGVETGQVLKVWKLKGRNPTDQAKQRRRCSRAISSLEHRLFFIDRLAVKVLRNSAEDFSNLTSSLALWVTSLCQHWLHLGLQKRHNVREHACKLIWFARRLSATSWGFQNLDAQSLWAPTASREVKLNSLALHQFLNTLGQNVPADIDIFISRIGDEAKTFFSVKPLNFADRHGGSPLSIK